MFKEKSLANRYIQYAMSMASNERSHQLASLSQEQLMAILPEDRDIPWLGHCINRCPGYKIESDLARSVTYMFDKNFATKTKARKFQSRLETNPETYTTPFPVMWLEWQEGNGGEASPYNGVLVENLDAGMRVTVFALHPKAGVYPTIYTPISIAQGTPEDMQTARSYPEDTPARFNLALIEERELQLQQQMATKAYTMTLCALTVLNSRKDIKLVPATEFANQQAAAEGEQAETSNTITKPLGLLTLTEPKDLQFHTGNTVELMREEQQEPTLIIEARKSFGTAPTVTSHVTPSKPSLLTRLKGAFATSQKISLADQIIDHGISTASNMRNSELSMLSPEELIEMPQGERDYTWLAHCIQKSTGYGGTKDILDAIFEFQRETYSDGAVEERVFQTLSKKPELYTPPVPAFWMEYETDHEEFSKFGYLVTRLSGQKTGLQVTNFNLSYEHGVVPQRRHQVFHTITESVNGKFQTILYRNNMRIEPQTGHESSYHDDGVYMAYLMMGLNDPSQPLKLTPALER